MLANWITLSRFPILFGTLLALFRGTPGIRLVAVGVLFIGLMLDTVDGIVARRTGQTSLFGSVLDIAADRTYELVLWFAFANLGLISGVIPLLVIARTALTDAIRSVGVGRGTAPFLQHRTRLGRFLVGSSWMRISYSASKTATFCGLALVQAFAGPRGEPAGIAGSMVGLFQGTAWIALGLCILRGIPVIVHGIREYWHAGSSLNAA